MRKTKFGHNLGKSRGKQGNLGQIAGKKRTFAEKSVKFGKIRGHQGNSRQIDGNIGKAGGNQGNFLANWVTFRKIRGETRKFGEK